MKMTAEIKAWFTEWGRQRGEDISDGIIALIREFGLSAADLRPREERIKTCAEQINNRFVWREVCEAIGIDLNMPRDEIDKMRNDRSMRASWLKIAAEAEADANRAAIERL